MELLPSVYGKLEGSSKNGLMCPNAVNPMQKGYPKPALSAVRQLRQQTAKQMNIPVRTGTEEAEA